MLKTTLVFLVVALLALAAVGAWRVLDVAPSSSGGAIASFSAACTPVSGVASPDDLQIDALNRKIYISSFDRSKGTEPGRGAIYSFELDDPLSGDSWRDRTQGAPAQFEPKGLYLFADDEVSRLFVINAATRSIDMFDIDADGDLHYLESVSERRLTSPNDLVATGPRSFYVTNDAEAGSDTPMGRLQLLFQAGSGSVLHYNDGVWSLAADGLRFANGIGVDATGSRLYVSETSSRTLRIFAREAASGVLSQTGVEELGAGPDNLNVDRAGSVWIAAQRLHGVGALFGREQQTSVVVRVDDGGVKKAARLSSGDDTALSGASSAARLDDMLVVAAQSQSRFLICRLTE